MIIFAAKMSPHYLERKYRRGNRQGDRLMNDWFAQKGRLIGILTHAAKFDLLQVRAQTTNPRFILLIEIFMSCFFYVGVTARSCYCSRK